MNQIHYNASTLMNASLTSTIAHLKHIATTPSALSLANVNLDSLETDSIAPTSTSVNRCLVLLTVIVRTLMDPMSVLVGPVTLAMGTHALESMSALIVLTHAALTLPVKTQMNHINAFVKMVFLEMVCSVMTWMNVRIL